MACESSLLSVSVKMEPEHDDVEQQSQTLDLQEQHIDQQIMVQQLHITEEQAQLMEQQGQIIVEVQIVEPQGHIVEQHGQFVVQQGQIVMQQGQTLESQGGQIVIQQGQPLDSRRHIVMQKQQSGEHEGQAAEQLQTVEQQLQSVEQQIQAIQQGDQQNLDKKVQSVGQQPHYVELHMQDKKPPLIIKQLPPKARQQSQTTKRLQTIKVHPPYKKQQYHYKRQQTQNSKKVQHKLQREAAKNTNPQPVVQDKSKTHQVISKHQEGITNKSASEAADDIDLTLLSHSCDICSKDFSSASNLYRHVRKVHNCEVSLPTSKLLCSLCDYECSSVVGLQKHCEEKHEIRVEQEFTTFESDEAFLAWKANIERETKSMFVKHGGTTVREGVRYSYYRCHRSGHFKSRGQGKRSLKTRGSNKINATCPAGMKVQKVSDNCLQVEFVKTHIGHTADVDRIRLTPDERKFIASKLVQNVLIEDILNEVHNSTDGQDTNRRLHLLKRHDIHNIERDFLGKYDVSPVEELRKSIKRRVDLLSGFVSNCEMTDQLQFIDRLLADTCSTVETIVGVFSQSNSLGGMKSEGGSKSRLNEENRPPPAKKAKQKKVANTTMAVPVVSGDVQEQTTATAILFLPPDMTYQMIKSGQTYDVEQLILQTQE